MNFLNGWEEKENDTGNMPPQDENGQNPAPNPDNPENEDNKRSAEDFSEKNNIPDDINASFPPESDYSDTADEGGSDAVDSASDTSPSYGKPPAGDFMQNTPFSEYTPSDYPKKKKLSGGSKAFIAASVVICCAVLCLCTVFIIDAVRNPGGSANNTNSLSSRPDESSYISSPNISLDDIVMQEDGDNLSPDMAYEKIRDSVVSIKTYIRNSLDVYSEGTGMYFKNLEDRALIITCAHVLTDAASIVVIDSAGNSFEAELVAQDTNTDIAVISVKTTGVKIAEFSSGNKMRTAQFVMAVGNPTGSYLASSATFGILSGKERLYSSDSYNTLLQFDASVSPGNSGGPLINLKGQVIGLVSSKIASLEYEGIGFAVPTDEMLPIVEDLCQYGYVKGRVRIGIVISEYPDYMVTAQNYPGNVFVESVPEGSEAYLKGMRAGDIIVSADGTKITSGDQLIQLVRTHKPDDVVEFSLYRKTAGRSEEFSVKIKLQEYKGE